MCSYFDTRHQSAHICPSVCRYVHHLSKSLCLTKYYPMKCFSFDQALLNEDVWRCGNKAPRILNFGTIWRWVVNVGRFSPVEKAPLYPFGIRLGGFQSQTEHEI
jgi:hypothetical protein